MDNKFNEWIGKKVFIKLKTGRNYSGLVKEVTENFIFIKDKFNEKVVVAISELSSLEEEK
jgi:ribosome maturation factor RimP